MEPEFTGFCRGCNGYSEHLKTRMALNNYTGEIEIGFFCPDCRERFGLSSFTRQETDQKNS